MTDQKVVVYDTKSLPFGMDLEDILEIYYATGVVTYDSEANANAPYIIDVHNIEETEIVRINRSNIYETNIKTGRSD